MKASTTFLVGFIASLTVAFVIASYITNRSMNTVGMYFVVSLIPILIILTMNSIYLFFLNLLKNKSLRSLLSFIPVAILVILSIEGSKRVSFIEGNLVFTTIVCAISIAISNLIWSLSRYYPDSNK
jgi:branched-subunit amino acid transport protein AzlD